MRTVSVRMLLAVLVVAVLLALGGALVMRSATAQRTIPTGPPPLATSPVVSQEELVFGPGGVVWGKGARLEAVFEGVAASAGIALVARLPEGDTVLPEFRTDRLSEVAAQLHRAAGYNCLYDKQERLIVFQLPVVADPGTPTAAMYKERLSVVRTIPRATLRRLRGAWSVQLAELPEDTRRAIVRHFMARGIGRVGPVALGEETGDPLLRLCIDPIPMVRIVPSGESAAQPRVPLSGLLPVEPVFMSHDADLVTRPPAYAPAVWAYQSTAAAGVRPEALWDAGQRAISLGELGEGAAAGSGLELHVDRRLAGVQMLVLGPPKPLGNVLTALVDAGRLHLRRVGGAAFLTLPKYSQVFDAEACSGFEEIVAETYGGEFEPFTMEDVFGFRSWEWDALTEPQRDRVLQALSRNWSLVGSGEMQAKDELARAFVGARVCLLPALDVYLSVGDGETSVSEAHVEIMTVAPVSGAD